MEWKKVNNVIYQKLTFYTESWSLCANHGVDTCYSLGSISADKFLVEPENKAAPRLHQYTKT